MPKKEYKPDTFLASGYRQLDLKYIFDHLRNIGIAAAVMFGGGKLINNFPIELYSDRLIEPYDLGTGLVILSLGLLILNYIQLYVVSGTLKSRFFKLILLVMTVPIYLLTAVLVYSYSL